MDSVFSVWDELTHYLDPVFIPRGMGIVDAPPMVNGEQET
jgi:hypothetical protein